MLINPDQILIRIPIQIRIQTPIRIRILIRIPDLTLTILGIPPAIPATAVPVETTTLTHVIPTGTMAGTAEKAAIRSQNPCVLWNPSVKVCPTI